jgi:hypothetical protein
MGEVGDIKTSDLIVCCGASCCVSSLLCNNCIGCTSEGLFLCCRFDQKFCRPVSGTNEDKIICILVDQKVNIVKPTVCCLSQQQICCLDVRAAFPCNKKVPCIQTLIPGCILCVNYEMKPGCLKKWKDTLPASYFENDNPKSKDPNVIIIQQQQPPQQVVTMQPQQQQNLVLLQQQQPPQVVMQRGNGQSYVVQQ